MENPLVEGFGVTRAWVADQLSKHYQQKADIKEVTVLGDTVVGYMSAIARVHLEWEESQETLPQTVIVKIPNSAQAEAAWKACGHKDEGCTEPDPIHEIMHVIETNTYTMFTQAPCPGLRVPEFFGALGMKTGSPALMISDITGATTTDLVDGFSDKQLFEIVDQLVCLHKWSFANSIWKEGTFCSDLIDPKSEDFERSIVVMADKIIASYPGMADCIDLLIRNYLSNFKWVGEYCQECEKDAGCGFVHGDLWAPQILWKGEELVGIVDWALCRAGTRTEDLLRVLVTSCSVEQRRRMTQPLLQYYVDKMGDITLEQVQADFNRTLPFTCGMTTFAVCMWTNSTVLRRGRGDDEERVHELQRRLTSIVEETAQVHGWK